MDGKLSGTFSRIPLSAKGGIAEAQRVRFPHLWHYYAYGVSTDAKNALRGQLVVTESDHTGKLLSATGVQIPGVLDDVYSRAAQAQLGVDHPR